MHKEEMIAALESSGEFKVSRRLKPKIHLGPVPVGARRAIFLDVETTGLNPDHDEIIELAMVPFYYSEQDEVVCVGEAFTGLRQPSSTIPAEVTKITGITDEMVAGQAIDPNTVAEFAGRNLIIAHNAAFDRPFIERFCPMVQQNPWACSMSEIGWKDEGYESSKLAFLALSSGFYYDRHRAESDCRAAIELLSRKLPISGQGALSQLLASARRTSFRCWAEDAPFETKDVLKERGYRWNGEANGLPRAWWKDIGEAELEGEKSFLRSEVYKSDKAIRTAKITAQNRYSRRITPCD